MFLGSKGGYLLRVLNRGTRGVSPGGSKRGVSCIKKHRQVLGFWKSPGGQKSLKKRYTIILFGVLRGVPPRGVKKGP